MFVANSDPPVPQGVVAGKYRLTRLLGRGGMGAVWEGTHTSLGARVAVKFIDAEYADSPEARSRFENEARAAARLRSRHVVEVYDHGVSDDGRPFIVMEFLQGEPLDKRLDRLGRLPARETAQIVVQICRALAKAHAANIVHRDLKPENVFLVWDDEERTDVVKVVDFGIAKFNDASMNSSSATRTGSLLGTPHYMSPEQARGLRSVDSRSDLWSVAVIAYRCIVGVLPFEGEAVGDLLVKLCTAQVPVPSQIAPDVPPSFDAWLAKALTRDPAQRFQTAAQLSESLAAVCGLVVRGQHQKDVGSGGYLPVDGGAFSPATHDSHSGTFRGVPAAGAGLPLALLTGAPTTQTPAPAPAKAQQVGRRGSDGAGRAGEPRHRRGAGLEIFDGLAPGRRRRFESAVGSSVARVRCAVSAAPCPLRPSMRPPSRRRPRQPSWCPRARRIRPGWPSRPRVRWPSAPGKSLVRKPCNEPRKNRAATSAFERRVAVGRDHAAGA